MHTRTLFYFGLGLGLCISAITGLGWSRSQADPAKRQPRTATSGKAVAKPAPTAPDASIEATKAGIGLHLKSEKILEIEKVILRPITFDFVETPLTDVIEFLRDSTHVNIVFDTSHLQEFEPDTPITLSLKDVTLRSALNLLLDPLELSYLVRDDALLIVHKHQREGSTVETRVYPVADLVVVRGRDGGEILGDDLADLVLNTLRHANGADSGENAAIAFSLPTFSLVVTETQFVHAELEALLGNLRAARDRVNSRPSPEVGDLSSLHELYLTRTAVERTENYELAKLRIQAASIEHRKAQAELRRVRAEAELAELRLKQAKSKANDKQKKKQTKGKDSD